MAEIALIDKCIDMTVSVLRKSEIIVAVVKSHVAGHDIVETTVPVTVPQAQAVQIILHRSHALFLVQLRKCKVLANRIGTRHPVETNFAPLDLVERTRNRVVLTETLRQVKHPECRRELETVRLRNRPVVLLDHRFVLKVEIIGNCLLLVKIRTEISAERKERNQARVKAQLELLRTGTFVTQNTVRTTVFPATHAIHLVEHRRIVADHVGILVLHIDNRRIAVILNRRNRVIRNRHDTVTRHINATVRMVKVKDVVACKKSTVTRGKEILFHERLAVTATIHVTFDVQGIARRQERKNVPPHIQLMVQFRRIGHNLVDLRLHIIGIAVLVHVAHVVQVENRQVEGLRPGFKFCSGQGLQPVNLFKVFHRAELEHAERTQLIFNHRMVGIRRIRRSRRTALGFIVRIAECRTV